MPKYEHFEDLPVWQEAARLYNCALDLVEEDKAPVSPAFRSQLERAALSVSNNVAEGFELVTTAELLSFLAIARGSAGEVRSMVAVVAGRRKLSPVAARLHELRKLAESCARQLTAWVGSLESSPVQGKRHLTGAMRAKREDAGKAEHWQLAFWRGLRPDHPLYRTAEARAARGEPPGQGPTASSQPPMADSEPHGE